jgi:hypothetical protein
MLCYAVIVHSCFGRSLLPLHPLLLFTATPLLPLRSDAAAQKQAETSVTASIEQFKKLNNGGVPSVDECEVSAGRVATAALLGNNPDQNSRLRLQGKVHDECLAQLNGSEGGESK